MFLSEIVNEKFICIECMFFTYLKCHNPNSFSAFCQKHIHNIIAKKEENQLWKTCYFYPLAVDFPRRSLLMSIDKPILS